MLNRFKRARLMFLNQRVMQVIARNSSRSRNIGRRLSVPIICAEKNNDPAGMHKKNTPEKHDEPTDPLTLIDGEAGWDHASLTDFIDRMNRIAFQRSLERRSEVSSSNERSSD